MMHLGVEVQHVSDVQALIVAMVAEHREGESMASTAERVLEVCRDAKPPSLRLRTRCSRERSEPAWS